MRINRLRFKNLNSLPGEWEIDFTHPAFIENGIFAITGPTGAGKSTILDAICLALYGETPRLNKISSSTNDIMSLHTGECFAELEFTTNKGNFRIRWSQKRAGFRPDGNLQSPKHEIAKADTGELLAESITTVKEEVEKVTGMDFKRFTRSMMLAQGGFDAFLKANVNERSEILEEITGTEIYSEISMTVYARKNEFKQEQDKLEAALGAIHLLTEEEVQELELKSDELQKQIKSLKEEQELLTKQLKWVEEIERSNKEINDTNKKLKDLEEEIKNFAPQQERLNKAKKAQLFFADFKEIENLKLRLKEFEEELLKLKSEEADILESQKAINFILEEKTTQLKEAEAKNTEKQKLFKQIRELDLVINNQQKNLTDLETECKQLSNEKEALMTFINEQEDILKKKQNNLSEISQYQTEHSTDSVLPASCQDLISQLKQLNSFAQDIINTQKKKETSKSLLKSKDLSAMEEQLKLYNLQLQEIDLDMQNLQKELQENLEGRALSFYQKKLQDNIRLSSELDNLKNQYNTYVKTLDRARYLKNEIQSGEKKLKEIIENLNEIRSQLDSAKAKVQSLTEEYHLAQKVSDLEEERKKLKDGIPCPLCGSLEHPYAKGMVPELDSLQIELEEAKKELERLQKELSKREKAQSETEAKIKVEQEELDNLDLSEQKTILDGKRAQLGLEEISDSILSETRKKLNEEKQQLESFVQKADELNSKIEGYQQNKNKLLKELEDLKDRKNECEKEITKLQSELKQYSSQLTELQDKEFTLRQEISARLKPLKLYLALQDEPLKLIPVLEERNATWENYIKQQRDLQAEIQEKSAVLKEKRNNLIHTQEGIDKLVHKIEEEKEALQQNMILRKEKLDDESVDEAEQNWENYLKKLHSEAEEFSKKLIEIETKLKSNGKLQNKQEEQIKNQEKQLESCKKDFLLKIEPLGCKDIEDYKDSLLNQEELQILQETQDDLSSRFKALQTQLNSFYTQLNELQKNNLTDKTVAVLSEEIKNCQEKLEDLNREVGVLETKLNENQEQLNIHSLQSEKIEAHKKILQRWEKLAELIGSADGKKYRSFAQGITFEILIANANQQLANLSPRYLLVRDDKIPLDLSIIDSFQGGEIRTIKNLSGGESFIVSLALALGLSRMSSKKISIDSLFLDEGFGSLDEESLEIALQNLAALNNEGKLIGIISHIPAIKERISTQIKVIPQEGGISKIEGIGCREIK